MSFMSFNFTTQSNKAAKDRKTKIDRALLLRRIEEVCSERSGDPDGSVAFLERLFGLEDPRK